MAETAICEVCRRTFRAKRKSAVYCSPTCRSRAFRARERATTHGWDNLDKEVLAKYMEMKSLPAVAKKNVAAILFNHGERAATLAIEALAATVERMGK
jgi:hypothetical protein